MGFELLLELLYPMGTPSVGKGQEEKDYEIKTITTIY